MASKEATLNLNVKAQTSKARKGFKDFGDAGKKSFASLEKASKQFSLAFKGAIALFAGKKLLGGLQAITEAAAKQEDAINALNTQLKLSGDFSEEASKDFQDFASELQKVSKQGDETTLELLALSKTFDTTNDGAKKLTLAATELAAATGQDVVAVMKQLGKTLGGTTGRIAESVPAVKELTAEQLKAGDAIDLVLQRFGGAATGQIETYSGAITQLSNSFGDTLEVLGGTITESDAFIGAIKGIQNIVETFSKFISDSDFDIGSVIAKGIEIAVPVFIKGFTLISKAIRIVVNNLLQLVQGVIKIGKFFTKFNVVTKVVGNTLAGIAEIAGALAKSFAVLGVGLSVLGKAAGFDTEALDALVIGVDDLGESLKNLEGDQLGQDIADAFVDADAGIEAFQEGVIATDEKIQELGVSLEAAFVRGSKQIKKTSADLSKGLDGPQTKIGQQDATSFVTADQEKRLGKIGDEVGAAIVAGTQKAGAEGGIETGKAVGKAALGGVVEAFGGPVAKGIFDVFANLSVMSDEEIENFINGFVEGAIKFIEVIADKIDVIIEALINSLIVEGGIIKIAVALIKGLINGIGALISALGKGLVDIFQGIFSGFGDAISEAFEFVFVELPGSIVDGFTDGIEAFIDSIGDFFSELNPFDGDSSVGGFFEDVGDAIGDGLSAVGDFFGFNQGGIVKANTGMIVPGSGSTDKVPALLTPGEIVIPAGATNNFAGVVSEIAKQSVGTGETQAVDDTPRTINLILNDEILATAILDLSQNNARLI